MTDVAALPYRRCVGIALFNPHGEVFVGRRKGPAPEHVADGYAWQMPQGGIDDDEDPRAAAERELYEETGVRTVRFLAEAPDWYAYDLPSDIIKGSWKGRFRGQTQKWFAFRFEGPESEIVIDGSHGHKPEFVDWRWVPLAETPALIIPFKRVVYDRVAQAFAPLARPD